MLTLDSRRSELSSAAPALSEAVFGTLCPWLLDTTSTLAGSGTPQARDFNDPIWKIITVDAPLTGILDTRLMQRLRRVRQLGLAYLVYTGANHTRFEHSLGAMHAAQLMFDRLADCTNLRGDGATRSALRRIVCLAALLHDCGHTAFSHVGERVLGSIFRNEFESVATVFDKLFSDPLSLPASPLQRKGPPAAELLSAMFVVSPSMSKLISTAGWVYSVDQTLLMAYGLVLGKPYGLLFDSNYYHFVKSVVSGDLDADKVDYVARDAFFSGIPTATDIDRLLTQLTAVQLTDQTKVGNAETMPPISFSQGNPQCHYLLGIKPSGASALEMFVMTRAYLSERIYGHHKIRASERLLERLLRQAFMHLKLTNDYSVTDLLMLLFEPTGDDGLLHMIRCGLPGDDEKVFSVLADRLLNRQLPVRAIAIAQRTMAESVGDGMHPKISFLLPWSRLQEHLSTQPMQFEKQVCDIAGLEVGKDVIVDWPPPNPIKERPDIWVSDPIEGDQRIYRVNQFFDVEQLSNAYRNVKQVGWVFTWPEHQALVAASAATQLTYLYDLLPDIEAFRRAKVSEASIIAAREQLLQRLPDGPEKDVASKLLAGGVRSLQPRPNMFHPLPGIVGSELGAVSKRLSAGVSAAKLDRVFYDDLYVALAVFKILLVHCRTYYRHHIFRYPQAGKNESRFQQHLIDFCNADDQCQDLFEVAAGTHQSGGITDLLFRSREKNYRTVVVELKSEEAGFESLYDSHAGQPMQYAEADQSRVSILYCQFKEATACTLADTIQTRCNPASGSPLVVLCLGQKAFWEAPSALGKTAA